MKISLKWLADCVKLPAAPEELASRLTMAGLEIEAIERPGAALSGVVVCQILESSQHPNADKLSVTQVDAGGARLQIVCGAKNYKVGDKVPLATEGTKLPNGVEIKRAQLRGVESFGMLCSARELGLAESADGLLILDAGLKIGTPIAQALGVDDVVFEVNVTPNRPDALSHAGIAREVAVLTGAKLTLPIATLKESSSPASEKVKVRIEDKVRCPRYAARVVEGVTIGPSPSWLADRLKACGVRSINNVVDVTNYVLLELGHPLHAFDLDKVAGAEIVVRGAKPGEKLTTLDGKERALEADDLLICDRDRAQAIAGVMGGAHSEVSASTKRILLESAFFQPSTVRRSAKRHGLHTEASHRFERGADISAVGAALDRAAGLIAELGKGTVLKGQVDVFPEPPKPRTVSLRPARVSELLGTPVPAEESLRILEALGFKAEKKGDSALVTVPFARVDVEREEDLIEEVARIRGYDQVPIALPRSTGGLSPERPEVDAERRIRHALAGCGFDEVMNYSFVSPELIAWTSPGPLEGIGEPREAIALINPLSVEQSVMRRSLHGELLLNVLHNVRHQVDSGRFYEWGRGYEPDPDGDVQRRPVARERLAIGGVLFGRRGGRTWAAPDSPVDFYDAKGAVEAVLSALAIRGATVQPFEAAPYHPRASARVMVGDRTLGTLGELHPRVARQLDIPPGVYLFELDAEVLFSLAQRVPQYRPLPRFPAVLRDLAVLVPVGLADEQVRKVIVEIGGALIEDVSIFDVYSGKPIPEGQKNLAYAIVYRASDRTLTDVEVNQAHAKIVAEVSKRLGGTLRA